VHGVPSSLLDLLFIVLMMQTNACSTVGRLAGLSPVP